MPDPVVPDPPADENSPEHIKVLRDKAKDHDKVKADNAALERKLAFLQAGFDVEHPLVSNLMTAYTGELTKDAVTAHMASLQVSELLKPTPPPPVTTDPAGGEATTPPPPPPPAGGTQAADRIATIDGGAPAGTPPTADPRFDGLNKAFDILEAGGSRADAGSVFFTTVFGAAVKGDARVLTENRRETVPEPEPTR